MHFIVTIYYNIISKFQKIAKKKSKIVRWSKKAQARLNDIILDACMKFQNYPMTNCRRRCILQLLYIIPFFQNFKKSPKIQK